MAKLTIPNGFSGKVGDLIYYQRNGETFVRLAPIKKSKKELNKDPRYKKTRENMAEFGHLAKTTSLIRTALVEYAKEISDSVIHNRLFKVLNQIKSFDQKNERGQRTVTQGLQDPRSLACMDWFNFNIKSTLVSDLLPNVSLNLNSQSLNITKVAQNVDPKFNHELDVCKLMLIKLRINLETEAYELKTSKVLIYHDNKPQKKLTLKLAGGNKMRKGLDLYLISMEMGTMLGKKFIASDSKSQRALMIFKAINNP